MNDQKPIRLRLPVFSHRVPTVDVKGDRVHLETFPVDLNSQEARDVAQALLGAALLAERREGEVPG